MDSHIPDFQLSVYKEKQVLFSDQLVVLMAMPNFCLDIKYLVKIANLEEILEDDFRSDFIQKILKSVCYEFLRVCFFWRNRVIESPNIFNICKRSLLVLKETRSYLSKSQAVVIFQALVYFLNDLSYLTRGFPEKLTPYITESSYVQQMIELVGLVVDDFHMVLKDGIEVTYVLSLCFDLLTLHEWPSEVVLEVIKLMRVAIAHYMAPNMALLVEDTPDTTVAMLGPFLYSKLLDNNPDIKKVALEVVRTSTSVSNSKSIFT